VLQSVLHHTMIDLWQTAGTYREEI
jgi:hypothetical protein